MNSRRDSRGAFPGAYMADDTEMRMRLIGVAAYRELCRGVRRSGRDNIAFAVLMSFLAYLTWKGNAPLVILVVYYVLIGSELAVGLFKWLFPSAEGHLLDGFVLLLFAVGNLGFQLLAFQAGAGVSPVVILFGLIILSQAISRFKFYRELRQMFAERPSAEHMAWFDDLVREIKASDPQTDELALDLPTKPHWKAKLLGTTAFFVTLKGSAVLIAGPFDFELLREKNDHGTGRRRALLRLHGVPSPEFEISDVTWANYQKWRAANPLPDVTGETGA
jgi:hypothetical protein